METIRKGYKHTDIGAIPEDWEVKNVDDLCEIMAGLTYSPNDVNNYGTLVLRSSNIQNGYLCFDDNVFVEMEIPQRAIVKEGDILVCVRNGSKKLIGKSAKITALSREMAFGAFMTVLRASIDKSFFFYAWQSELIVRQIEESMGATINQITNADIKRYLLCIPPNTNEQRAIAEVLSDIDSLIEVLDKKIAKKRAIKDGAMQQLLTSKKRLPGFSDPWVENYLDELGVFISGNGFPINHQGCYDGYYPFYKVSDFNNKGNEFRLSRANNYISIETAKSLSCNIIPANSIVFAKIGAAISLERKKATSVNCCIDNNMMAFLPNINIHPEYILRVFQTIKFWNLIEATALPSLSRNQIGSICIDIPQSIKEQQAVAQILTNMDDEIEKLEQQRSKYTALKQGTMQQLLTGQIRLVADRQIRQTDKSTKQANVHFKRSVWAAEIVDRLCNEPTFGHVKMEKMIFLTEHLCGVDIGSNYHRDAAGPYDNRAIRSIDSQLKKQNWFEAKREERAIRYIPLSKRGGHKDYFNKYFSDVQADFDKVINTFSNWNTERCEIVATLYSAWKDIVSAQKSYSDEDIINEVLNNWHESKKRIPIERWQLALNWMREKGFEPKL